MSCSLSSCLPRSNMSHQATCLSFIKTALWHIAPVTPSTAAVQRGRPTSSDLTHCRPIVTARSGESCSSECMDVVSTWRWWAEAARHRCMSRSAAERHWVSCRRVKTATESVRPCTRTTSWTLAMSSSDATRVDWQVWSRVEFVYTSPPLSAELLVTLTERGTMAHFAILLYYPLVKPPLATARAA